MGCAAHVPVPPVATHDGDAPVIVPYPPPPAQVEMVGPAPDDQAVWVDGSWLWTGQAYVWNAGGWQHPAPGLGYAPPMVIRQTSGELVYFPGSWHGAHGAPPRTAGPASESAR